MMTKLETLLAGVVVGLLALAGWTWHERGVGARDCTQADARAVELEKQLNDLRKLYDSREVSAIWNNYTFEVAAPVLTPVHVRLCDEGRGGKAAITSPPAGGADAVADLSAESDGSPMQRDVGPELQDIAKRADAQVKGLQEYVRQVCLSPAT